MKSDVFFFLGNDLLAEQRAIRCFSDRLYETVYYGPSFGKSDVRMYYMYPTGPYPERSRDLQWNYYVALGRTVCVVSPPPVR